MDQRHRGKIVKVVLAASLCLAVVYLAWPVASLQVRTGPEGDKLSLALPLSPGQTVILGFVHSLYRVVQEERYVLRNGQLCLTSVFFGSFDALNYYDPLGVLPRKAVAGGYEVRIDPPRNLPVNFATGHSTAMWLRVGENTSIGLERIAPHEDRFSLQVVRWPRVVAWFMELVHG